jgi:hypothetical protein
VAQSLFCLGKKTYSVLGLNEGVVDSNNLDIRVLDRVAEHDTADTAEAIDADLDSHLVCGRRANGVSRRNDEDEAVRKLGGRIDDCDGQKEDGGWE